MPLPITKSSEEEALHREMERISLDWVMIQNPTDEDFYIDWNPWHYLVPNKKKDIGWGPGKLEVQRYLAVWYCKHMKDKIINEKGQREGEALLKKRTDAGQPALTKFEEQKAVWEKTPRTTSEQELANIYPNLFLGITREFGLDYAPNKPYQVEQRTPEEVAIEKLQSKKYVNDLPNQPARTAGRPPKVPSVDELEELIAPNLASEVSA